MTARDLILASASPRRRQLLALLGVVHSCQAADVDETPWPGEEPERYVQRIAAAKARAVAMRRGGIDESDESGESGESGESNGSDAAVLAADTTVVLDGQFLHKPADRAAAMAMLARLSGREHRVMTALCLRIGEAEHARLTVTEVEFVTLDRATCEAYLATDEPWDKAGGYAIQGLGGALVQSIRGSYSNVVGLPLAQTRQLLREHGFFTRLDNGPGVKR